MTPAETRLRQAILNLMMAGQHPTPTLVNREVVRLGGIRQRKMNILNGAETKILRVYVQPINLCRLPCFNHHKTPYGYAWPDHVHDVDPEMLVCRGCKLSSLQLYNLELSRVGQRLVAGVANA